MAFALEELTNRIIGCGIAVHRGLGGGLLESCYDAAMCIELGDQGLHFVRQPLVPVVYKDRSVGQCRPDFIVEKQVVLELKCAVRYDPVFRDQVLTYLKGTGLTVGLLMNFHAVTLRAGLRRFDLKDGVTTEELGKLDEK
jgi:GxxExxY protein